MTTFLLRLWHTDRPLTAVAVLMLPVFAAALAGIWVDPRQIAGAPAWLKPAKFAVSFAIYALTLAWVFTWLAAWPRTRAVAGWSTALVLLVEMAIIGGQAWRGTMSHFNVGTPLDAALFRLMGAAILVQTLASIAVAVALWRQTFVDPGMAWALRLGMVVSIAGAATGGLMTRPTDAQLAEARTGRITITGAHTVGAPDGGPGLPGTRWSVEHGDLRVPHFFGLHALQAMPLLALGLTRLRRREHARARLVIVASASYTALFVILVWQALRGQSIVAPDATTLIVLGVWLFATAAAATRALWQRPVPQAHAVTC